MDYPCPLAFTFQQFQDWAVIWLPILFMGLIAVAILWMLKYMPRTKPQEIKPRSSDSIRWHDVAGVRLHRRAGRGGHDARQRRLGREGPDAEPAAGRAGRLLRP